MPCYPRRYDRRRAGEPAAASYDARDHRRGARADLDDDIWDYIAGAAETETTARRNRLAIDSLALRPRILRDVSSIDPGGTLLGHPLRIPVVLAPIGARRADHARRAASPPPAPPSASA